MRFPLPAIAAFLLSALVLGCANPGQPKPPSLRLPTRATQPAAERLGDQVILTWNTPGKTTDDAAIRTPITARICRESTTQRPGATPVCTSVVRVNVLAGPSRAAETLPASLASGAPSLLTYRIELLNPAGRSDGPSDPVYAAAGAAPPPAGTITVTPRRDAALITWARTASPAPMHLTRTTPTQASPSTLQPRDGQTTDPGGLLDPTVQDGETYTYVAGRIQIATVDGHPLELHGPPSPSASLTYHNVFPPRAPAGLVSVPGGGFGQAVSIDLSWDPNLETDVLGYNIYRSDAIATASFVRLNAAPLPSSAYRDLRVEPGHSYLYRVTAIDQRHNESAPGDEIHETLRK